MLLIQDVDKLSIIIAQSSLKEPGVTSRSSIPTSTPSVGGVKGRNGRPQMMRTSLTCSEGSLDQTKVETFGHNPRHHKENQAELPALLAEEKHGGGGLMVWSDFTVCS